MPQYHFGMNYIYYLLPMHAQIIEKVDKTMHVKEINAGLITK